MPYSKITKGKDKGKYKAKEGKLKGKPINKAQMQAVEIAKHRKGKK